MMLSKHHLISLMHVKQWGFTIETKKTKDHTTMDFLDLEIDTMMMEAHLPMDKRHREFEMISQLTEKRSVSFHKLEKLLIFLSFRCTRFPLNRSFYKS